MSRNQTSSAIIDGLLKFIAAGGILTVAVFAPNALQALDKPLEQYFKRMDEKDRQRKYRRYLSYMKQRGLIKYKTNDYEHGIQITPAGRQRAKKLNINYLSITIPKKWDRKWRIVLFDIPETKRTARNNLILKLKELGFTQLQRSVWVHPFHCRQEVETISIMYNLAKYITYLETDHIDSQDKLKKRFRYKF